MSDSQSAPDAKTSALGLTCNIDRRGQRARAAVGVVLLVASGVAFYLAATRSGTPSTVSLVVGISLVVGGLFCLFEAANGWCAVRAMGFRTKL
jgi:hypothetical protein